MTTTPALLIPVTLLMDAATPLLCATITMLAQLTHAIAQLDASTLPALATMVSPVLLTPATLPQVVSTLLPCAMITTLVQLTLAAMTPVASSLPSTATRAKSA
jgi:hypothetical protein